MPFNLLKYGLSSEYPVEVDLPALKSSSPPTMWSLLAVGPWASDGLLLIQIPRHYKYCGVGKVLSGRWQYRPKYGSDSLQLPHQ